MKFCCIIPDRNDRPEFTAQCLKMLDRMTVKPDKILHINRRPDTERFDLVTRIRQGVSIAKADGFDWCFIIENDDFYPANYFERFLPYLEQYDFIGDDKTIYFNINTRRWSLLMHDYRASLFTTAFKISALNNYTWPADHTPFLDIDLWKYARHKKRKFIPTGAIGIKHGSGLCGGKGHTMKLHNDDAGLTFLSSKVDPDMIDFYANRKPVTA
jgi:hypothetical protein